MGIGSSVSSPLAVGNGKHNDTTVKKYTPTCSNARGTSMDFEDSSCHGPPGCVRIYTDGKHSYANSIILCLLNTPVVIDHFLNHDNCGNKPASELINMLKLSLIDIWIDMSSVETMYFTYLRDEVLQNMTSVNHITNDKLARNCLAQLLDHMHDEALCRWRESNMQGMFKSGSIQSFLECYFSPTQDSNVCFNECMGIYSVLSRCNCCGQEHTTYEPWTMLEIPVYQESTLSACLRRFTEPVNVPGCQDKLCCEGAIKTLQRRVMKLPNLLVMYLERETGPVPTRTLDFPVTGLDISPLLSDGPDGAIESLYNLRCVTYEHVISPHHKSYFSGVRSPLTQEWNAVIPSFFNEAKVVSLGEREVCSGHAVILYYEQDSISKKYEVFDSLHFSCLDRTKKTSPVLGEAW